MQTGALIGTENDFMRQRFRFARQVLDYCHDYWSSFEESHLNHVLSHLLPRKHQRMPETAGYSIMSDVSHMRGLRPNWLIVVQSTYLYMYTHVLAKEWSVLETILYTSLTSVFASSSLVKSAALRRWQQPLLISRPCRWPDTRGCHFHSCYESY